MECFKIIGKSWHQGSISCPFFKNMFYFQFIWVFVVAIIFTIACVIIVKESTGNSYVIFFIGWCLLLTFVLFPILLLEALFGSLGANLGVWAMYLTNQAEGTKSDRYLITIYLNICLMLNCSPNNGFIKSPQSIMVFSKSP